MTRPCAHRRSRGRRPVAADVRERLAALMRERAHYLVARRLGTGVDVLESSAAGLPMLEATAARVERAVRALG